MINIIISNLLIIIVILTISGWFLLSTCSISTLQQFNVTKPLSNNIEKTENKEFAINNSSNISRTSLRRDKNDTPLNHPPAHNSTPAVFNTTSWQLAQAALEKYQLPAHRSLLDKNVKILNDFHYEINKSNQENNVTSNNNNYNKQTAHLLSNTKLVNSSTLSPSPSPSPTTTAAATASGTESLKSTSEVSSYFERVEMHESLTYTKHEKLLLHRNKRYLLFPEGSSFQLVFDLIIPIVDYTNFAIIGITCAVAWELPSKPPSEIIENIRTKLNDGTYGLSRRNDSTQQPLAYIDSQDKKVELAEGINRWRQGAAQLSTTATTTSGHEDIFTSPPKPPRPQPSSNYYYNNYIKRGKTQQPNATPTKFFYGQHPQQQQWQNYNYEMFDTNRRKASYASTNNNIYEPTYRNDFTSLANKHFYYKDQYHSLNKFNPENRQKQTHQHPQQTKELYTNTADYLNKENWWERNKNRIEKHWHKNQQKWYNHEKNPQINYQTPVLTKRTSRNRKFLSKKPKHRIYPIFGKRRRRRSFADHCDDMTKKLQEIHEREHLRTRQKLYGKIEKLYETRGQNGTACVLRALCETTKRMHLNYHHNEMPQSFVMELLRSIFALPQDTLTKSKESSSLHVDDRYVNAVVFAQDASQSCTEMYHDCEYSITFDS